MTVKSQPLLSVIIPNYNHARYLRRAIEALRAQERPADEIIVVDDASTDDSLSVLAELSRDRNDLTVVVNESNRGAVLSLQRGLEAASGRYVCFAAADDNVLPGFFATALDALSAHPEVGLFCGDCVLVNGETGRTIGYRPIVRPMQIEGVVTPADTERLLRRADNFIMTGSAIFRRDLALAKGGFDPRARSFADGLLARKVALTAGFCYRPQVFAAWNVFDEGLSRSIALEIPNALQALAEFPKLIAEDEQIPAWYGPLMARRWRFNTARLALASRPPRLELLYAMAGVSRLDHAMISAMAPAFRVRLARWLALAWLTVRLRPFRIRDVIVTAMNRWREGLR